MSQFYIRNKGWVDTLESDNSFSYTNHSFHYGNLIFEGIRFYHIDNGVAIFRLEEHVDRFFQSANILKMALRVNKQTLMDECIKTVADSELKEGYLRPIAFFMNGLSGLNSDDLKTDYVILAWKWTDNNIISLEQKSKKLLLSNYIKLSNKHGVPQAKCSGNYLLSRMALLDAHNHEMDDAILLDERNFIAECSAQNIFFVKNKVLYTPSAESCLKGITRDVVIRLAEDNGIKVVEDNLPLSILNDVDEVFLTSTASEITPIQQIYNKLDTKIYSFPIGHITKVINSEFKKIVRSAHGEYSHWLTLVN